MKDSTIQAIITVISSSVLILFGLEPVVGVIAGAAIGYLIVERQAEQ
jgi:hypothetical protein